MPLIRFLTTDFYRLPTCILALISINGVFAEAEWPELRGPGGQGNHEVKSAPLNWGPDTNVVWKTQIPGKGWSSPVNSRVFLTTAVPLGEAEDPKADQSLVALCLNAQTGEIIWDKEVFKQDGASAPGIHSKNSHASPTPIVSGDRLYVHFGHQGTACLTADGDVVWTNRELKYPPVHGNGGSPALVGKRLIFNCDAVRAPFVAALKTSNGSVAWKTPREVEVGKKFSFSTPQGECAVVATGRDFRVLAKNDLDERAMATPAFAYGAIYIRTHPNSYCIKEG